MACQKPVVAFNSGGISEIIDHDVTGLLIPFGDKTKMAQAVRKILASSELALSFGRAGKEKVERLYTAEHQVKMIEKIYDGILRPAF